MNTEQNETEVSPQVANLMRLAESASHLHKSTKSSLVLMLLGIVLVVGSTVFSYLKLAPLEGQIREKKAQLAKLQMELDKTEAASLAVSTQNANKIEKTQATLKVTAEKLDQISKEIKTTKGPDGPNVVPNTSQDAAIEKIEDYVNSAKTDVSSVTEQNPPVAASAVTSILTLAFSDSAAERIGSFDKLLSVVRKDPKLMAEVVDFSLAHLDNENGIYNMLVLADSLPVRALRGATKDVIRLRDALQNPGEKTQKVINRLNSRLKDL